jgi:tetratricopeptide (TPR) repeat protein
MARALLPYLILVLAVAAGYAPSLANDLVWDDRIYILEHPPVREARLGEILTRPIGSYYRPLVFATFAIEAVASDAAPALFHLTNLTLHAAVACLLFAAASALGASRAAACAAALLFALHPVQSEAVLYVSGRTDVLASAFGLGALLLHARARGWRGPAVGAGARWGAAICFALALGCKESAASLPLALVAGDRIFAGSDGRPLRRDLLGLAPYLGVLAGYALWRWSLQGEGLAIEPLEELGPRLRGALAALTSYAGLLLLPLDLHLERFVSDSPAWRWLGGLALATLGLLAAWRARPAVRFWLAWAAVAYLPTSNLLPVYPGLPAGTVFAPEHFLYLPSTGLAAAAVLAAEPRLPRRVAAIGLAVVLAAFLGLLHQRASDWRDEETLYAHTLARSPASARIRLNLGNLYLARGETERAAAQFQAGLARHPDDVDLLTNAGLAWLALGRFAAAEVVLHRAVALSAGDAQAWANLGALYGTSGRLEEARRAYGAALARDPANADALEGMRILDELAGAAETGPRD